jgi:hypothetical protein
MNEIYVEPIGVAALVCNINAILIQIILLHPLTNVNFLKQY